MAELYRVLRPSGELCFYEYVAAHRPLGLALQRAADATLWIGAFGGCHTTRETVAALEAGFAVERGERLRFPQVEPRHPHIVSVAPRT